MKQDYFPEKIFQNFEQPFRFRVRWKLRNSFSKIIVCKKIPVLTFSPISAPPGISEMHFFVSVTFCVKKTISISAAVWKINCLVSLVKQARILTLSRSSVRLVCVAFYIDPKHSRLFTFVLLNSNKHESVNTLVCFDYANALIFHCQQVVDTFDGLLVFERKYIYAPIPFFIVVLYRKKDLGKKIRLWFTSPDSTIISDHSKTWCGEGSSLCCIFSTFTQVT